ncbi:tyrosine-protein kinase STYK1-like isoform X1 [Astyanax mexicanus]|uniref:Tyrosine-protein kinase STYK1-like isoform X1 n=1 Tax=Astyanax mexicanus TaxID=7994 RepID=A0A8T2LBI2_ASTMX|nr:tyrosine-protein kinase STYK1-like isoform X1 [Astyanax mexicanus]
MDVQAACNISSLDCDEEGSGPLALIIIPSLLALSTLTVITLIIWSFLSRRTAVQRSLLPSQYINGPSSLQTLRSLTPGPDALSLWEIPAHCHLEEVEFLENGHYGPICRGQLKREGVTTSVVVKTLKGNSNSLEVNVFVELALFHAAVCKHERVVRMLHCQTRRLPMYLLFEEIAPGNLLHFLWSFREGVSGFCDQLQAFSERSVYLVAKQVASGLDYLLSEHRLVHGDVAARSMLIGSGLSVKVSGLAVAFEARRTGAVRKDEWGGKVPLKWQAPERLMKLPITARSDVWSFGILLYEMITLGDPPFPDLDPSEMSPKTLANYRLKRPENCGGALYDLMKYCCMWNFKHRPAYSDIIKLLDSYLHLADTKPLRAAQSMDVSEYRKRAGLSREHRKHEHEYLKSAH